MKITVRLTLVACATAVLLGAGLSGCSSNNKIALSNMSKDQQIQAVGQMDAHSAAIRQAMKAKIFASMASATKPGAKPSPPQVTPPAANP